MVLHKLYSTTDEISQILKFKMLAGLGLTIIGQALNFAACTMASCSPKRRANSVLLVLDDCPILTETLGATPQPPRLPQPPPKPIPTPTPVRFGASTPLSIYFWNYGYIRFVIVGNSKPDNV